MSENDCYIQFFKYYVFFLKCRHFSVTSAAALVFDLSSGGQIMKSGVHTLTPRENRERPGSRIYFQIFEKNTIFN